MPDLTLEFKAVTIPLSEATSSQAITFALKPGQLGVIRMGDDPLDTPLADAACGLCDPLSGHVFFRGASWTTLRPDEEARMRNQIGRILNGHAWISNLDIDENIILAAVHHARWMRPEALEQAVRIGQALGLQAIPPGRPSWIQPRESMLAQWVRALLTAPPLLLLEYPSRGLLPADRERCAQALKARLEGGGAALVIECDDRMEWLHNLNPCFTLRAEDIFPEAV